MVKSMSCRNGSDASKYAKNASLFSSRDASSPKPSVSATEPASTARRWRITTRPSAPKNRARCSGDAFGTFTGSSITSAGSRVTLKPNATVTPKLLMFARCSTGGAPEVLRHMNPTTVVSHVYVTASRLWLSAPVMASRFDRPSRSSAIVA